MPTVNYKYEKRQKELEKKKKKAEKEKRKQEKKIVPPGENLIETTVTETKEERPE